MLLLARWLAFVVLAAWPAVATDAAAAAAASAAPPASPEPPQAAAPPVVAAPAPTATALQLFSAVESAWTASDAERLASLVDTTSVRIALKPGAPPTTAMNRVSAAFLFQDPMRLVRTREFRIVRLDVSDKGTARATASWVGDWGGRQGVKLVRVTLTAGSHTGSWLLTEVRSSD